MRKLLTLATMLIPFLIASSWQAASCQNRVVDDKWALVIGISKFQDSRLNLKYPAKDAKDFADFLVDKAHFAKDHVKLITDHQATRERILSEIADWWLPRAAHPNDLVVIYISSHGSPSQMDNEGLNYLVAHDTKIDSLYATGIRLDELAKMLKRVHCNRTVVFLDACHSGAAKTDAGKKGLFREGNFSIGQIPMGEGLMMICSSRPEQVSWESKKYDNSVFTKNLLEALNSKGEFTRLGEAFRMMQDRVQSEVLRDRGQLQTPVIRSAWKGDDLVIASKPAKPRPTIPDKVRTTPVATTAMASPVDKTFSGTQHAGAVAGRNLNVKLHNQLAILPVTGPKKLDIDDYWMGFARKNNMGNVRERLKNYAFTETIQIQLKKRLDRYLKKSKIGTVMMQLEGDKQPEGAEENELMKVDSKSIYRVPNVINWQAVGAMSLSKYLLEVTVHDLIIRAGSGMGDEAGARVSAKLVSGKTGEIIWLRKKWKFTRLTGSHIGNNDDSIFAEIRNFVSSKIAKELSKKVANALKDQ